MTGNDTILLVEDDENDVLIMKRALKAAGFTNPLVVLEDGQQALDYFAGVGHYADRDKFPLPALAFIDINLPLRTGLQVLEDIQGRPDLSNIVMVVLTSSNLQTDIQRAYRAGANSYVVKPPTRDKLLEVAKAFKLYWAEVNQQ